MVVIEHLNHHSLNLHKINKAMPLLDSQARPDIEIEPRPERVSSNSHNIYYDWSAVTVPEIDQNRRLRRIGTTENNGNNERVRREHG